MTHIKMGLAAAGGVSAAAACRGHRHALPAVAIINAAAAVAAACMATAAGTPRRSDEHQTVQEAVKIFVRQGRSRNLEP
jgi:hypothetical protein